MRDSTSFPAGRYACLGLMSGTSVDGVDAALVKVELRGPGDLDLELGAARVTPLDPGLREEIFALFEDPAGSLERLALLDLRLGEAFGAAARSLMEEAGLGPGEVDVIGSHGQTIRHVAGAPGSPRRGSLQIGSGVAIALATGVPTVSDFRVADIAAGGTGAPFVPFLDRLLAPRFAKPVVFQNFGGIGNLCWIGPDASLLAFDTGPGCMIADRLAEYATEGKLRYDRDGELGARGRLDEERLANWLRHPFLRLPPPRSAGREEFGDSFWRAEIAPALAAAVADSRRLALDLLRTAEAFSARSAARACLDLCPLPPRELVVTGGGARNPHIMAELRAALPGVRVSGGDEVGVSVDFKEAEAFALMGLFALLGLPNTEPRATGASRAVVAGKLSLP
jgi:anhydro-N-acetylmuramic acid kinase